MTAGFIEPDWTVHESFLVALTEYQAEDRYLTLDLERLAERQIFLRYIMTLDRLTMPWTFGVAQTTLWWVDGDEYLGRLTIRSALTDRLWEEGGHIGYDVRPSARRQGHGRAMLRAALPIAAAKYGLDRALVTCDWDNVASERIIRSVGGQLLDLPREKLRGGKLRFWIPIDNEETL